MSGNSRWFHTCPDKGKEAQDAFTLVRTKGHCIEKKGPQAFTLCPDKKEESLRFCLMNPETDT
jgi:hypothetical protein